jgi:hypothetical protein
MNFPFQRKYSKVVVEISQGAHQLGEKLLQNLPKYWDTKTMLMKDVDGKYLLV